MFLERGARPVEGVGSGGEEGSNLKKDRGEEVVVVVGGGVGGWAQHGS